MSSTGKAGISIIARRTRISQRDAGNDRCNASKSGWQAQDFSLRTRSSMVTSIPGGIAWRPASTRALRANAFAVWVRRRVCGRRRDRSGYRSSLARVQPTAVNVKSRLKDEVPTPSW